MYRPTIKNGIFQLDRKIEKQKGSFLGQIAAAVGSPLVTGLLDKGIIKKKQERKKKKSKEKKKMESIEGGKNIIIVGVERETVQANL